MKDKIEKLEKKFSDLKSKSCAASAKFESKIQQHVFFLEFEENDDVENHSVTIKDEIFDIICAFDADEKPLY